MSTKPQKPQRAGAMWVNVKKGASQDIISGVAEALKFLRDNHAYFSVKVGDSSEYVAFFNGFRKSAKDPAIIIYDKMGQSNQQRPAYKKPAYAPKPAAPRPAPIQQTTSESDSFGGEEVPFL